jgi:hypothetical protein
MPPIFIGPHIGIWRELAGGIGFHIGIWRELAGRAYLPTYVLNLEDFSTLVCTTANRYLPHVGADYTTFFYAVPSTYLYLPQVQPKVDYIY